MAGRGRDGAGARVIRRIVVGAVPFVVAAALVLAMTAIASGVTTTQDDANDTRGSLDVRRVSYHWVKGAAPSWEVRSFHTFTARGLWDRGYLYVEFDTRGDERGDFYALLYSDGRRMRGQLFRTGALRDAHIRPVQVRRPDRSSVAVRVPWSWLRFGPSRQVIRWWVTTSFTNATCQHSCADHAPDEGAIEDVLPGGSPSPSPTPTGTITATPT